MTRTALLLTALSIAIAGCSDTGTAEAIDEANSVVIVSEDANTSVLSETEFLNPARDPEGNNLMGEPDGESEATAESSTHNEPGTTEDNYEVIDRDADNDPDE